MSERLILDPHLYTLLAGWELLLGLWVLSGWSAHFSRWVVAVTFGFLATVSGYLGWLGVADCGCFGDVSVSPWWVFGLDVGILVASCLTRPPARRATDWAAADFAAPAGIALALIVIAYSAGVWAYGSLGVAVARIRGEVVVADPDVVDYGEATRGETRIRRVTVWNFSDTPIRVIGGTADCSCTALSDLPVTVPAGESRPVTVELRYVGTPGVFAHTAELMVDEGSMTSILHLTLRGRVEMLGAVPGG
ncbi:MAG TPA: DUF1573 domain-containing protein [Fimbriiglobus sp.]|nr:DUF1573 domain-containing protein [Fimbriiglobus sp.]